MPARCVAALVSREHELSAWSLQYYEWSLGPSTVACCRSLRSTALLPRVGGGGPDTGDEALDAALLGGWRVLDPSPTSS